MKYYILRSDLNRFYTPEKMMPPSMRENPWQIAALSRDDKEETKWQNNAPI